MDNLIFSLGVTMPIFIVMFMGKFLYGIGVFNDDFVKASNKMIFCVAMPIKLFMDMLDTSFDDVLDMKVAMIAVVGTLIAGIFSYVVGKKVCREDYQVGTFAQASFRGNFVYLGFSLLMNMTGEVNPKSAIILAFSMPVYNTMSVIMLIACKGGKFSKAKLLEMIKGVVTNPLILGIFFGLLANLINLRLPDFLVKTSDYFVQMVTPLALITIGATFNFKKISGDKIPIAISSLLKLIIYPFIAVVVSYYMGVLPIDIILLYVYFGVPTATSSYILATALGGDGDMASSLILVSTIFSIFSITAFVYAFSFLGWI